MTFKERLTDISNVIEFELRIAQHCAEIKDAMEAAAHNNYRTFQIEIVRLLGNSSFSKATAENCYSILSTAKPDKMALIVNKVKDYLGQLGFSYNDVESTPIKNSMYHAVVLKVEW
jgi:hypothetical protein